MTTAPRRGDLYMAELNPIVGREQGGYRPVLVASIDQMNQAPAEMAIVIPLSTTPRENLFHVRIEANEGGLGRVSYAMPEMICSVSIQRLKRRTGRAPTEVFELAIRNAGVLIGLGRTKF